jgi:hypothetical protein
MIQELTSISKEKEEEKNYQREMLKNNRGALMYGYRNRAPTRVKIT